MGLLVPIMVALSPIFGMFVLGAGLKKFGLVKQAAWDGLDRLVFLVLFPTLLFVNSAKADLEGDAVGGMLIVLSSAIFATAFATRAVKSLGGLNDRDFVTVYQAAYRMNAYVGIAASTALLGIGGAGLAAIAVAIISPLINGLSVIALVKLQSSSQSDSERAISRWEVLGRIMRGFFVNPLIMATLAGVLFNLSGLTMPSILESLLTILASGALPLALLGVGAGLSLSAFKGVGSGLFIGCFNKLILAPGLTILAALAIGFGGAGAFVAVIFTALPTSASAYQMTKAMGGNADLMAVLITAQTVVAAITMPLILVLAGILFLPQGGLGI